jgi:ATP phosphoribosyltransferase
VRICAPSLSSRLHQPAYAVLRDAFGLEREIEQHRRLRIETGRDEILLCRGADVPTIVASGVAEVGLTGYDVAVEWALANGQELDVRDLGPQRSSFVCFVTVPGRTIGRIYSEYPAITARWLNASNRYGNASTVLMHGSSEAVIAADPIAGGVLLVTSGATLQENNLSDAFPLLATDLCLVSRPGRMPERWGRLQTRELAGLPTLDALIGR